MGMDNEIGCRRNQKANE